MLQGKTFQRMLPFIAVLAVNAFVIALLVSTLIDARGKKEQEVRATTASMALLLDRSVSELAKKIDLSLAAIRFELERQLRSQGRLDEPDSESAVLGAQTTLLSGVAEFRVTDADGLIVRGPRGDLANRVSLADRPHFIAHLGRADGAVIVSNPVVSRTTNERIISFSARYNYPDGRFAGIISASVPVAEFGRLLSGVDVGPHGVALLRSADTGLIAHQPDSAEWYAQIGAKRYSAELKDIIASGIQTTTFHPKVSGDNFERTNTYRRLSAVPFHLVVGLGAEDYLAEWNNEVRRAAVTAGTFLVLTILAAWLWWRSVRLARVSNERYRSIIEASPTPYVLHDDSQNVTYLNAAFANLFGYTREDIPTLRDFSIKALDDPGYRRKVTDSWRVRLDQARKEKKPFEPLEARIKCKDGSLKTVLAGAAGLGALFEGEQLLILYDITGRKEMEQWLRWSEERFRSLMEFSFDLYWETDTEHRFVRQDYGTQVLEPASGSELGKTRWEVPYLAPDEAGWQRHRLMLEAHVPFRDFELARPTADGGVRYVSVSGLPVFDEYDKFTGYRGVGRYITERKRAELDLERLANFDALTGLPNRRLFQDRLGQALVRAQREHTMTGLFILDLDHFKLVNDTLGHAAGDELLLKVASRLHEGLRAGDTLARLGGDEFALVLPALDSADSARVVAQKMIDAMATSFSVGGRDLFASVSIGIAVFPQNASNAESLVQNADSALYKAKEAGRRGYQYFTPSMNDDAGRQLALEKDLHHAFAMGEFELFYQPKAGVSLGHVTGMEALLRWRRQDGSYEAPADFVPALEKTGLIAEVGLWVVREACRQLAAWEGIVPEGMSVAVNVSPRQFRDPGLAASIRQILLETGCAPQRLELEITESTLMHDIQKNVHTLEELRAAGVRIAVDDFGTGYSSLAYLKQLPIDTVKIDRSFIVNLAEDSKDAAITIAIVSMARSLGYRTVAEGVETALQRSFLESCGCDEMQGHLLSRALPAPAVLAWLTERMAPGLKKFTLRQ